MTDHGPPRPEGTRDHRRRTSNVSGVFVESSLTRFVVGTGVVEQDEHGGVLTLPGANSEVYSDAQLQDYAGLARRDYPWRPPLHFSIEARFSSNVHGTAGFGFWNNPLSLRGVPALPRALWFFWASPPSQMELAQDVPGHGWKAATIDAGRGQALAWAPFAPVVLLLCRHNGLRRRLWPWVQRALAIEERVLDHRPPTTDHRPLEMATSSASVVQREVVDSLHLDRSEWHRYEMFWLCDRVIFAVDGHEVFATQGSPRGPLGLVLWVDNQWARVTPAGSFGAGLLDNDARQWLEYRNLRVMTPGR